MNSQNPLTRAKRIAMVTIFAVGFFMVFFVGKARADSRHDSPDINISIPSFGSDCNGSAAAMASGQHQFFITEKNQLSLSGAYFDGCGAASVGSAFSSGDTLYSGQLTCDEDNCGGGVSATLKF